MNGQPADATEGQGPRCYMVEVNVSRVVGARGTPARKLRAVDADQLSARKLQGRRKGRRGPTRCNKGGCTTGGMEQGRGDADVELDLSATGAKSSATHGLRSCS
jgi:hypothetical protein